MTRSHSRCSILLLGCCLSMGACAVPDAPIFAAGSATVTEVTDEGVAIEVELLAQNPNEFELPLREVRYRVTTPGGELFEGVRSPEATLPAGGERLIRLPAVAPMAVVDPGASGPGDSPEMTLVGELLYQTPGVYAETLFDSKLYRPSAAFTLPVLLEPRDEDEGNATGAPADAR